MIEALPRTLLMLLLAAAVPASEPSAASPPADQASAYLVAFRAGDFRQAQNLAREALAGGGDPAVWWGCLGAAAARADDPWTAVDAVVRAQRLGARLDQDVLTLHVTALGRIQAWTQARIHLDLLARQFPYTPLAARDARLALAIDRRLAEPIPAEAVTWQVAAAADALASGRPGLALIHVQEGQHLARRGRVPWPVAGAQLLATACLELGDPGAAETALAEIPDDESSGRIGLLRAAAQVAGGRQEAARETLARLEALPGNLLATDAAQAANIAVLRRLLDQTPFPARSP